MATQLFPIPGNKKQRVVGAGANTITIMIDELCVLTVKSSALATRYTAAIDRNAAAPTVNNGTSHRNGLR